MSINVEDNIETPYTESGAEKNNRGIAIKIFVVGLIISLILCGVGIIKQNNAKKTNEERRKQAYEQSQAAVDQARKRLEEIKVEIPSLQEQYEAKKQEADSMDMRAPNWFADHSRVQREASNISSQISALEQEQFIIEHRDYTVYYSLVEPKTYMTFYYVAAGIFGVLTLVALIFFLTTRKK